MFFLNSEMIRSCKDLQESQYYIDKTGILEKKLAVYPSVYMEGAAASGKTTAVKIFLVKHPEIRFFVIDADRDRYPAAVWESKLKELGSLMREERICVVFENLSGNISSEVMKLIAEFLRYLPDGCHGILVGRERPAEELLDLLWKRKLELISPETLRFTREDIRKLVECAGSTLNPEEIFEETGGWPGCVEVMLRLSVDKAGSDRVGESAAKLRRSYEIETYIRREILSVLSEEEQEIMQKGAVCPWMNGSLCENVWGISGSGEILERLGRKGMLLYDSRKNRWKIANLFRKEIKKNTDHKQEIEFWKELGEWYDKQGCVTEALYCLRLSGDESGYRSCMMAYYDQVPFLNIPFDDVMGWQENTPQICYLRGMYCYFQQDQDGLEREIRKLEKNDEIYLNLAFVNPRVTLDEWLSLLVQAGSEANRTGKKIRLYHILGGSISFLCGLRDLTGMFACSRKEENRKARIWKEYLGEEEWKSYQLARADFYMETERMESIPQEDQELLDYLSDTGREQNSSFRLVVMYLLCKQQRMHLSDERKEEIHQLEEILWKDENAVFARNAEAISNLYSRESQEQERLICWLRYSGLGAEEDVQEGTYMMLLMQTKGYVLVNQYEKAKKIIQQILPYLQYYRLRRWAAELLFLQALIFWEEGRHNLAVRNAIESFLVTSECRYVGFYAEYGRKGKEVLDAYVEWLRSNKPEGWHRKKKYNYGNVLRMPMEDYMEVILRCAKKRAKLTPDFQEDYQEEKLTMTETIVLQRIARGLTNTEICREMNLKLPTIKSHIYSIYKKLGVNSRVQAILKGKELGILE